MHAESGKEMKRSHEAMESKGQQIFKVCDYVREDKHVQQGQVRYENNISWNCDFHGRWTYVEVEEYYHDLRIKDTRSSRSKGKQNETKLNVDKIRMNDQGLLESKWLCAISLLKINHVIYVLQIYGLFQLRG